MTKTNETTQLILNYLFKKGIYAWRNSVGAIKSQGKFYQMGKLGSSDIFAVLPPHGTFLGIEIKTGADKLRPEQVGFIKNVQFRGGGAIVVKDFDDFFEQFRIIEILKIQKSFEKLSTTQ